MRISDAITAYILHRIEQAEDGTAELQRNVLAEELGCVPSQINYVLASRFTPQQGYIIESRRGGGGYIRIRRVQYDSRSAILMHIVNSIGDTLESAAAQAILQSLAYEQTISEEAAKIMAAALSDKLFGELKPAVRDKLRAAMLKQMLMVLICNG